MSQNIQNHSLRQEIKEELTYFPLNKTGDYERISNNIIKLIEKRIDSISECEESDEGGYHGDEEFWAGFSIGFEQAFNKVKKEMLKS